MFGFGLPAVSAAAPVVAGCAPAGAVARPAPVVVARRAADAAGLLGVVLALLVAARRAAVVVQVREALVALVVHLGELLGVLGLHLGALATDVSVTTEGELIARLAHADEGSRLELAVLALLLALDPHPLLRNGPQEVGDLLARDLLGHGHLCRVRLLGS